MSIPGLEEWIESPQGRYVMGWERLRVDAAVSNLFGFNAVQLGLPGIDLLRENRIPLKLSAASAGRAALACDFRQLPFPASSIDLLVLPHVLEFCADRHQILREVERVLVAEGSVVITGFNPYSLWGIRGLLGRRQGDVPWNGHYLGVPRLKDWLSLLSFDAHSVEFGCYAPPVADERWLARWRVMEKAGVRWWPFAGGAYVLHAIKRVHGMRMVAPPWRERRARLRALAPAIQRRGDEDRYAA